MKTIYAIVISLSLFTRSACLLAQTQLQMNQTAVDSFKKVDHELNDKFTEILKLYASDTAFILHFKTAEERWIEFRDAQLNMRYPPENNYGSVKAMCVALYLEELTKDRIKTLQTWIDGVEEGDVCNGSIKVKD